MGRYTDALDNRREMHADAATRGHDMVWRRKTVDGKPSNSFDGECKHCGAQMGVGWSWSDSNHPNRDARKVDCTGPGTTWQSDMQRELASQRFRGLVQQFGQDVKDNHDRAWLQGQGIEASKRMNREAVLLDERGEPLVFKGRRMSVPLADPMRRTAHVSGNQIDVFHCPFCGSGAIVARSDMSIECSFCNSAFTVTVSPMFPAFPMSVGGQPYPWPGRPDGGMDPAMMGDPNAAGGGFGGQLVPGGGGAAGADDGDGDGDDDGGPPWAQGDQSGDSGAAASDGDDEDTEAEVGGKKKPPFGKKSVRKTAVEYEPGLGCPHCRDAFYTPDERTHHIRVQHPGEYSGPTEDLLFAQDRVKEIRRGYTGSLDGPVVPLYRTATGAQVPEREFMRHLAILTAHDPNAMAAKIKQERLAR